MIVEAIVQKHIDVIKELVAYAEGEEYDPAKLRDLRERANEATRAALEQISNECRRLGI